MKSNKQINFSIKLKLLTTISAGIVILVSILTVTSSIFIHSSFNKLYLEKLSSPSRTLLAQYSYADILPYVEALKSRDNIVEDSNRYLADRETIEEIEQTYRSGNYPSEYEEARTRMLGYIEELSSYKNDKYYSLRKSLLESRVSTGVKNIYILADIGLDDGYVFIYNTFYQADTGIQMNDDFGTATSKANYPGLEKVYDTGDAVYIVDSNNNHGLSRSFTPVKDGYGDIVAVICVDVNLESIGNQLNQFLMYSIVITIVLTAIILLFMLFMLQKTIIRPVKSLTGISREIADGNVYVEIPKDILARNDEMGVLGNSYESMRVTLEELIYNDKTLFESIIIGKLDARGDSSQLNGLFARLIDNTNDTLNVIELYFNSIPASFAILGPDYEIVYSNKIFKETFSRFTAKDIYQVLLEAPDEDYNSLKKRLSATLMQGEYHCLRWFDFGEVKRCFSFICSSVAHGKDKSGAVIVALDNTELVLTKDKALSANKAKSEFLSRISHELRTPLNAILSLAKLGLNDTQLNESTKRFEKIVSSSAHLTNIINDVLEMSRMESGKTEIRYAPMDVSKLIGECVSMLSLKAEENGNELISYVDPSIPGRLSGDEFRIKQIVINLISNAIKFTKDGKISVSVTCAGKTGHETLLAFSVADTGIGMSEEFLEKIFTPFEQEDSFLSRRYEGSGLGLSISHNLVSLMGGSMEVHSKPGEGSRFVFTIKFESLPAEAEDSVEGSHDEEEFSITGKRLLLVDDIEINRIIIREVFLGSGAEIEEAADGEEALEKYTKSSPFYYDCILMDIQMPKMDGYKTTMAIRQTQRADCYIPIIAMTANALKEDVDYALEIGMTDHIAKPVDFDLCIKIVKKYCAKNR